MSYSINGDFLERFLKTYRPSGYEKDGAYLFSAYATQSDKTGEIKKEFIDRMWNSCVSVGSDKPDALRILVSGHSDQNCLIITDITKNGFLKYMTQGGFSPRTVIDSDMFVMRDDGKMIPCFCSYKAIHLEKPDDRKKCPEHKDLYLDLGCSTKEEVEELGIHIGNLVVFDNSRLNMNFGTNGQYIVGSGLDDGVACGIAFDVISNIDVNMLKEKNIRLYSACITSEETGARGVGPTVRKVQPHISIDIDVCHDSTSEIGKDENSDSHLGKGVVISYGPDKYRPLADALMNTAKDNQIDYQLAVSKAGCTNTNDIQRMSDNCSTELMSIPCRYMHSGTHEMVAWKDLLTCGQVINKFIENINPEDWK